MGEIIFRPPAISDGSQIKNLIVQSEILDVNSTYCYLLLCRDFSDTCVVAEKNGEIVGFLSAYCPPHSKRTIFIWQIGVALAYRKKGLGISMLETLLQRNFCKKISFLETTITPTNLISRAFFRAFANKVGTKWEETKGFDEGLFQNEQHQAENLIRIGPFSPLNIKEK
ncbi:MAG: diaminobutyrate acetyltransferase [bacterium]